MISKATIESIREKVDLQTLLENRGISLKRSGSRFVGLCPVHNESTPSFSVNPSSQTYHCFGCGISGDVFSLLQELDGYTFTGAVEALAETVGVVVENSDANDENYAHKKAYYAMHRLAATYYRSLYNALPPDHPARRQLIQRNLDGLTESWNETIGIGYTGMSPHGLSRHLMQNGYSPEQIAEASLGFVSDQDGSVIDRFRNRLMWEIRDVQGRVIGFGARRLAENDKGPKYLNTSQTLLYNKSKVLYGLDRARKEVSQTKSCYVVEGYTDVMALNAIGIDNVVASCGTAFGSDHAAILRRLLDDFEAGKAGKFIFAFDGDEAGQKAAQRVFTEISPSISDRAYVAVLSGGDPCDIRLAQGDEGLKKALTKPIPLTEFVIMRIAAGYDLSQAEGKQAFVREALVLIQDIQESALYDAYRTRIAALSGISIAHFNRRASQRQPMRQGVATSGSNTSVEKLLLATVLQYPTKEAIQIFKDLDFDSLFFDEAIRDTLEEALLIAAAVEAMGSELKFSPRDFTNEALALEVLHINTGTEAERASAYIEKLLNNLEKQHKRALAAEKLQAAASANSPEEALAVLIAASTKKKD